MRVRHASPGVGGAVSTVLGKPPAPPAGDRAHRIRVMALAALGPIVVSYLGLAALAALVTVTAAGTSASAAGAFGVAVPLWLVAHQVPLQVSGAPLSVLPLAATVGLAALVARSCAAAMRRLGDQSSWAHAGGPLVAVVAGSHAVLGVLGAALLSPAGGVDARPVSALLGCAALAGGSAALGVAGSCRTAALLLARLPGPVGSGLRAAASAVVGLLAAGALLLLGALLVAAGTVHDLLVALAPDAGSGLGLMLLSAAYLPNAVLGALAWCTGPGVGIGALHTSPLALTGGAVSPLPLLAVLPRVPPPSWAVVVFALPLAVGTSVGWTCAGAHARLGDRLRAVTVAAGSAGLVCGMLAVSASGRLGSGTFDPVRLSGVLVGLAVAGWLGVPGAVVALLSSLPLRRSAPTLGAPAEPEVTAEGMDG